MVMQSKSKRTSRAAVASSAAPSGRVLIIEARYYDDITDRLLEGTQDVLSTAGIGFDVVSVPGALEIPVALSIAIQSGQFSNDTGAPQYAGVVALGCVIRGETAHFDIVSNNANHWLTEQAVRHGLPFGNAILTVETMEQAMARAEAGDNNKGGDAARACLRLMALAQSSTTASQSQRGAV
jgi:6,7-dimethyl-8-ribityllumazine synthase